MKFNCQVIINRSRKDVIALFDNPDNLQFWQDDFVSFNHLSGTPGQPGAQSKLKYKKVELVETVLSNTLPEQFDGSYEGSWGKNTMKNRFKAIDAHTTTWDAEVEYVATNNFIMKMMARFAPGIFRKQTQKWMDQFKDFCENKTS